VDFWNYCIFLKILLKFCGYFSLAIIITKIIILILIFVTQKVFLQIQGHQSVIMMHTIENVAVYGNNSTYGGNNIAAVNNTVVVYNATYNSTYNSTHNSTYNSTHAGQQVQPTLY